MLLRSLAQILRDPVLYVYMYTLKNFMDICTRLHYEQLLLYNVSFDNVASMKADRKVVREDASCIGARAYSQLSPG